MIRALLIGAARFLVGGQGVWIGCRAVDTAAHLFRQSFEPSRHAAALGRAAAAPARDHPSGRRRRLLGQGRGSAPHRAQGAERGADRPLRPRTKDPLAPLDEVLARGESLIIFPEGTRAFEKLPGPFKSGLYHLAEDHPEVELVPVFLDNLRRALPKGSLLPVPISCVARFGPPIALQPGEAKAAFLTRARDAVVALA